jgi:hypothetical protein
VLLLLLLTRLWVLDAVIPRVLVNRSIPCNLQALGLSPSYDTALCDLACNLVPGPAINRAISHKESHSPESGSTSLPSCLSVTRTRV